MKIAHIFYSLSFGGIETLLVNICNWQTANNNNNVTIILVNADYEQSLIDQLDTSVKIIFLNRRPGSKSIIPIVLLNLYLLKYKFDILHIHSAAICYFIMPFLKSKKILHIHDTKVFKYLPAVNKYIAISNSVKSMLEIKFGCTNATVVYNGVKFPNFIEKSDIHVCNKIVCIGRLKLDTKNQDGIVKEFAKIKDEIKANLYIIGDGPDKHTMEKLIISLNLEQRVFLLGNMTQKWIQENLHRYDLFVQASHHEGLGITALEASAACLPMLLSKVDGHLEISENGKYCDLFNLDNSNLSLKILEFYNSPELFLNRAKKNRSYFEDKFGFIKLNKKIINIYKSI
jgi:glycosyltransferase involved in cell wall biosynthesis